MMHHAAAPNITAFCPRATKLQVVAFAQHRMLQGSALSAYDCTDGMTYNSHFFIRIAILEMICTGLPRLV
jgi:hypothetical protein